MSYNSKYTGAEVEALLDAANGKQDKITDLETIRSGAAAGATALQSVPSEYVTETELTNKGYATISALKDKVDKVTGKQLSTEDFTSTLKTKLEGLSNYDDTELSKALSTLRGDFDKLVSGDTTTAIKTFNEVIAFLDGVQDTQDLSSIIASIEQQIAGKMDKVTLATVATSGSYNDLSNKPTIPSEQVNADWNATSGKAQILNKPTIPSAVTESTVSGWGFTKNTGTYSKPSGGIPKSDLATAVQTLLGKADAAIQYTSFAQLDYLVTANGFESKQGGTIYALPDMSNGDEDDIIATTNTLKTINGQSIVGSGDITISGGGGGTITGVSANGTSIATSGVANIPAASTSAYGVTKLSSATNSTSTSLAATASAVKAAYDLANNYKGTVTGVKVNGSTKTPSSGTVDIGNVVTSIKINGSTKTPSNGVVDLGTISGGGSSSGGSGAYAQVNHGTSDTTFTLTPNTFHVWDEVSALTLTLGSETAGVANEYLFQFTSGATAASLTLPEDIKWTEKLVIEANRIYQVSILKGLASVLSWENAPTATLITFYYNGINYQAEDGMTWEDWCNSAYNKDGFYIEYNGIYSAPYKRVYLKYIAVKPSDKIKSNTIYDNSEGGGGAD